ncbi:unannotated protein [freshwater metagenome]|uniref:Unannotated protein n=1 Tax=freshwater metagenome TaxID=449393 RepID=A0A6J6TYN4_9ZZZZ
MVPSICPAQHLGLRLDDRNERGHRPSGAAQFTRRELHHRVGFEARKQTGPEDRAQSHCHHPRVEIVTRDVRNDEA